jgi:hypothetical protein
MTPWWVTVRLDPTRTRDDLIQAKDQYGAGWLYRHLYPDREVLLVRPAR